jgi:hypothetical protein
MKRTTGILVCILAAGLAWAQNPQIIQNTRTTMNTVQKNTTAASNEALGITAPASRAAGTATSPAAKPTHVSVAAQPKSGAPAKGKQTVSVKPAKAKEAASVKPAKAKETAIVKTVKVPAGQKVAQKKVAAITKTTTSVAATTPSSSESGARSAETAKGESDEKDSVDKKWSMTGKRDPFISPVVSHAGGSGCSTGKKCLEIGAINLRGVVRSDAGFIAVVTNSLNKAYFLRENDPVFDGYVVKITGDSIVFQETMQDRLGKTFTREVVKKITTPAV